MKRYYNSLVNCEQVVIPNFLFNLADIMTSDDLSYSIRAVIAHKSSTNESGHYTATIFGKNWF